MQTPNPSAPAAPSPVALTPPPQAQAETVLLKEGNNLPPAFRLLTLGTANVLNLARPNRQFYPNDEGYSQNQYERKVQWLGERFRTLNADALAVQEVWDESALRAAVAASGLHYSTVTVPGAENAPEKGIDGAIGTPSVGLVTRLPVIELHSLKAFPAQYAVDIPELGTKSAYERAPLHAVLQEHGGEHFHLITVHLKSKRPKFLQDAVGNFLEDKDDPKIVTRASLRSLLIRAAEAAALRGYIVDILHRTREPLVLLGDFNDAPNSVTTQMIAATQEIAFDKGARDTALFNAYEMQGERRLKRDVAYSHIHQGLPEVIDQILVSEEWIQGSKHSRGDVLRVDYFNDHLHEGRDRAKTDHALVRAVFRLRNS